MPASHDVIVIGTGVTGLTAAKQIAKRGLKTATVESLMFGGLVININELEPGPDGGHGSGTELASNLMMEVSELGAVAINGAASAIAREGNMLAVTTEEGVHRARAVIVASGAKLKRLGIPGEMDFEGRGVSQCADCDGPMYKDEDVVVIGGGDSALQEALVLANYCKQVYIAHRGDKFRAQQHLIDAVGARANIKPLWNTQVEQVMGEQMVKKVRLRDAGGTRELPCAGFFAYIGLEPVTDFVPGDVKRDANGYLVTEATLRTTMDGVYAAGAVRAGYGGMLTHAIADAETVAKSVASALGK
jgi:thioredoxin reductase (NADPH)